MSATFRSRAYKYFVTRNGDIHILNIFLILYMSIIIIFEHIYMQQYIINMLTSKKKYYKQIAYIK